MKDILATASLKTAAAYIRVSTEEQAEYSPEAQLAEIRKYAGLNGYSLPDEHVYIDEGISGKRTAKREAFNRMIGTAKTVPRPFDAILLWKYSRFARNREDSIVFKSMLRKELGIEVISITEPVGDDKMSVIVEALIEAMDEYYSLNLAEEVRRGMTEKARRGGLQCAPAYGYAAKDNRLIPVESESALVRLIFERFAAGEGLLSIAQWLNDSGAVTRRGKRFENRSVEYILRNPVYIGKLRWNPSGRTSRDFLNGNIITADSGHEPLISEEVWQAAQTRMEQVKALSKYRGRPESEHRDWLSGLVRCAECGKTLVFVKPRYWRCNGYARGACKCSQHISGGKLKGMIIARLENDLRPEAVISRIALREASVPEEAAYFAGRLKQTEARLSRLREAYLAGAEDLESYAASKAVLEERLRALKLRCERQSPHEKPRHIDLPPENGWIDCVSMLKDESADMRLKYAVSHSVIEKCVFSKAGHSIKLVYRLV